MKCDVLIIGAGISGLASSIILQKHGFSTCLLEKNESISSYSKKYDITEGNRIAPLLKEISISPDKQLNVSEWISKNYSFVLKSNIKDFYFKRGNDQDSLERKLYSLLDKTNSKIFFNSKINHIKTSDNRINNININSNGLDQDIIPTYVIIADGADSFTREYLQIKKEIYASFQGYGIILKNETKKLTHTKIFFNTDYAPNGYVYSGSIDNESFHCIVAEGKNLKKEILKNYLQTYLNETITYDYNIINHFEGKGISGTITNHFQNAYFIGSSALLNDPFLGYGLNYAIESAYYASKAIIKDKQDIYQIYLKQVQKEFSNLHEIRKIWRKSTNPFFDELLQVLNGEKKAEKKDIQKILAYFQD